MHTLSRLIGSQPASQPASQPVSQPASAGRIDVDSRLFARRLGRVMGGGVLALGPALVFAQYGLTHADRATSLFNLVPLIALLWISAAIARAVGQRFGRSNAARAVFVDDAFAVASYVVPAVGIALVAPLSLQALVGAPFWLVGVVTDNADLRQGFDGWVAFALAGTLHVHIAFAVVLGLAARRLALGSADDKVPLTLPVMLSFFPGAILLFPPVLVWVTGALLRKLFIARVQRWKLDDDALAPR